MEKKTVKKLITMMKHYKKQRAEIEEILDSMPVIEAFTAGIKEYMMGGWSMKKLKELYPDIPVRIEPDGDDWYRAYMTIDGVDFEGWMSGRFKDDLLR